MVPILEVKLLEMSTRGELVFPSFIGVTAVGTIATGMLASINRLMNLRNNILQVRNAADAPARLAEINSAVESNVGELQALRGAFETEIQIRQVAIARLQPK